MTSAGRLRDRSQCPHDSHGCPSCPHATMGPAITGSSNVFINGLPALRLNDQGIHSSCCGPNQWKAISGCSSVFVNNLNLHRKGDLTSHCGGQGKLIDGSTNVLAGDTVQPSSADKISKKWIQWVIVNPFDEPFQNLECKITLDSTIITTKTNFIGNIKLKELEYNNANLTITKFIKSKKGNQ